ncbi:homoserine O-succinyltransferase [Enterococcus sp. JM4C]|uniref:homoserine O-succinyltransferase n=1 Tax=Candidatus Enterococcus huntleyi TaxID=1857217 RepID=UPI001379C508|nr:homoserine O-succinyltransferase [Enterococcus sp. JM4C]KAF1295813.1 homoserine O-succinyltransferase [Enterococcus sp. JM4C]
MPIKLLDDFPAKQILEKEDIFAIQDERARQQDIRPLKLLVLNLMPNKIDTETQLLRLISQTPLQIDVEFLKITSHVHKNTSLHHLKKFYLEFEQIKDQCYDALIITGAPIETLAFEEVNYWQELQQIMDWSQTNVTSTLHICWGAQASLYHHYQIEKVRYDQKLFGIYSQKPIGKPRLLRGFDDLFFCPQSRYTGIDELKLQETSLSVLARSEEIGATIIASENYRNIFVLGHFEYDTDSLANEYARDQDKGLDTLPPAHYFVDKDQQQVNNNWRAHANLLYHNWLNDVYQFTPYKLEDIKQEKWTVT